MLMMAIDGGKSKTCCVIFNDEGETLAMSSSGPSGLLAYAKVADRNIRNAIDKALLKAGVKISEIDLIVISLADLDTRRDWILAKNILRSLGIPKKVKVILEHDAVTAYYAVTYGAPGVAVIAGTGSIAFGMNKKGERARVGGWGWLFDDEGSAFWIAKEALAMASKAVDGRGEYTELVRAIMEYFNLNEFMDIIDVIYKEKDVAKNHKELAKLAEIVDKVAVKGDNQAREILIRAGIELANMAYTAAEKLKMINDKIVVGGIGSVFKSRFVRSSFKNEIKKLLKNAYIKEPLVGYQSLVGPIILALKEMGIREVESVVNRISRVLRKTL